MGCVVAAGVAAERSAAQSYNRRVWRVEGEQAPMGKDVEVEASE